MTASGRHDGEADGAGLATGWCLNDSSLKDLFPKICPNDWPVSRNPAGTAMPAARPAAGVALLVAGAAGPPAGAAIVVEPGLGPGDDESVGEVVGEGLPVGEVVGDGLPVADVVGDGLALEVGLGVVLGLTLGEGLPDVPGVQLGVLDGRGCPLVPTGTPLP